MTPYQSAATRSNLTYQRIAVVALFVLAIVLYMPTLSYDFNGWDDVAYIIENPLITDAGGLWRIWFSRENEMFYPLTFSAYWVQFRFFGENAAGYHAVSVLLHAINCVLLVAMLRRLGIGFGAALVAASIFAFHPVQVMSVAWIAEQKNLLSCLFVLLTVIAWTGGTQMKRGESPANESQTSQHSLRWYAVALLCFAAALLSKSAVLGLPAVLFALDVLLFRRSTVNSIKRIAPMIVLSIGAAMLTVLFEQKFIAPTGTEDIPAFGERLLLAAAAPWWYLKQLIVPLDIAPFYPLWSISVTDWRWWIAPIAWLMAAGGLLLWLRRDKKQVSPWITWSLVWFLVMLAPMLGIIPFGNMHATFVSDHFLYVAIVGPLAFVGFALQAEVFRHPLAASVVVASIAALAIGSVLQMPVYRNELSLWTRAVQRSPGNYVTNLGMGIALRNAAMEQQDRERATIMQHRSLEFMTKAASLSPQMPEAHLYSGKLQIELGDLESAEQSLRAHLAIVPESAIASERLAHVLERAGRPEEALAMFERAALLDPTNASARLGLGRMYLGYGRYGDAEQQFRALIELRPDHGMAYVGLATCLRAADEWSQAASVLRSAVTPTKNDVAVRSMLALILATADDPTVRNGTEAVEMMELVIAEQGRTNSQALDTLAAAYAEVGRFDDAALVSDEAAVLAERQGNAAGAAESRRRSGLYRSKQPLRQ